MDVQCTASAKQKAPKLQEQMTIAKAIDRTAFHYQRTPSISLYVRSSSIKECYIHSCFKQLAEVSGNVEEFYSYFINGTGLSGIAAGLTPSKVFFLRTGGYRITDIFKNRHKNYLNAFKNIFNKNYFRVKKYCQKTSNEITSIQINNYDLKILPFEVFSFKALEILDLSENKISFLSKEIIFLDQLYAIDLFNNQLLNFPKFLKNLSCLKVINMSYNDFKLRKEMHGFIYHKEEDLFYKKKTQKS